MKRIDFNIVLGTKKSIEYCLFRNSINYVLQLQSVEVYLNFSNCLLSIYCLKSNTITQKMIDFLNCCCSVAKLCLTLCDPATVASQASLSFTISQSLLNFISIEPVMLSNHLILCHSLHLLPSIFPRIKVYFSGSALPIRWPKYWNFSFSIRPSNEYSGLVSFRSDWFDLAV